MQQPIPDEVLGFIMESLTWVTLTGGVECHVVHVTLKLCPGTSYHLGGCYLPGRSSGMQVKFALTAGSAKRLPIKAIKVWGLAIGVRVESVLCEIGFFARP